MRTRARCAGAAVAVAAALLLGGCGSGGDGEEPEDRQDTSEQSPGPEDGDEGAGEDGADGGPGEDGDDDGADGGSGGGGDDGQDGGGDGGAPGGGDGPGDDGVGEPSAALEPLQGTWFSQAPGADAQDVVIVNITDNMIGVAGTTICSGSVDDGSKPMKATLTCEGEGGEKYTKGTVNGVKNGKLSIAWGSGKAEEYISTADLEGDVPVEKPTAGPAEPPEGDVPELER
ncbi:MULTISPECIES: hypothetical protein [Streptomyces]|uniref:hypothetical protein n=1 Tax=Streptomyces TaxID=1883 RepID=UPI0022497A9E|nr:hypothetical protein [Streptomyces sp. JHD 1]MCX2969745.1 hypothetical protein [Streptomyces sp. JHD 1]